ncbi:MAG: prolipoprotein diacylglyceryl transferase [Elusimicrobia bacterium]|nr:prolipoprotein diacylglyceryl transferase [Elusimicrobiota bacterium]
MHPYLFEFSGIKIPAYGVMVFLGYLSGIIYLLKNAKKAGFSRENILTLMPPVIIGAILGGKILYILTFWNYFGDTLAGRLTAIIKDFRSGFVFYGGLAGGFTLLAVYAGKLKIGLPKLLDFMAPAAALGHSLGRLGCFFAGCCHGKPSTSLFAITFDHPESLVDLKYLGMPLHPVQIYEAAGNFALFLFLDRLFKTSIKRKWKPLTTTLAYLSGYSGLRFFLEFFRGDNRGAAVLSLSNGQIISIAIIIACALVYFRNVPKNN